MDTVKSVVNAQLCIGCGFCATVCVRKAISMRWDRKSVYVPVVDSERCDQCGCCSSVCPNEPDFLLKRAIAVRRQGPKFGVSESAQAWYGHDADPEGRLAGASGGLLTAILSGLLDAGEVDGIIGPKPVQALIGQPHVECAIHYDKASLIMARSSHYHPLNYAEVLQQIAGEEGKKFAILGVPCIIRSVGRLPERIREKITFVFCLVCSHNTSGRFTDCLAVRVGMNPTQPFLCDLRKKNAQMKDAGSYFNYFLQEKIESCRNRFDTDFTVLWRNYFFAMEGCLYCPDFYGSEADCSVKDPWGVRDDPRGWSLLLIRNPILGAIVKRFFNKGKIVLEPCTVEKFRHSQISAAEKKATGALSRMKTHPVLLKKLGSEYFYRFRQTFRMLNEEERKALQHRFIIRKSNEAYENWGANIPINDILSEGRKIADQTGQVRIIFENCWEICQMPFQLLPKIFRRLKHKKFSHH